MKFLAALLLSASVAIMNAAEVPFYVGTYTKPGGSQGIYRLTLDTDSGKLSEPVLAAESKSPSFLALHPGGKYLYAVNEAGGGSVSAFALKGDGTLTALNQQSSKGGGPCHVWVDGLGKNVLVANYGGGSVACLPIKEDGSLVEASAFIQHTGSSVNPSRQKEPHAHGVYVDAANRFAYVPDLGLDKVMVYRFDPAKGTLVPNTPPAGITKPGGGPRHFALHPSGSFAYVINEMGNTVEVFKHDAKTGALESIQEIPTLPSDFTGKSSTAEIFVHPNGRFVYGSNRGHDSIAAYSIDASTGKLTSLGQTLMGGKVPRGFGIDPSGKWLIAGGQNSDDLHVLKIDGQSGKLTLTEHSAKVGAPVCVIFAQAK
jgi:6-phosphogluconolactonase